MTTIDVTTESQADRQARWLADDAAFEQRMDELNAKWARRDEELKAKWARDDAALEAKFAKTFQRAQFDVVGWHRAAEMRLAEHAAKFTVRVK